MNDIGMTNKQFQGFVRLTLAVLEQALEKSPDNPYLKQLIDTFQAMLEDA